MTRVGSIFLHHVSLRVIESGLYGVLIVNPPGNGSIWKGRPIEPLISSNNVSIADSTNVPIHQHQRNILIIYALVSISVHPSISFEMHQIYQYLESTTRIVFIHTIWYRNFLPKP